MIPDQPTQANLNNSPHAHQDDPTPFVKWVARDQSVSTPDKIKIEALAERYRREKSGELRR